MDGGRDPELSEAEQRDDLFDREGCHDLQNGDLYVLDVSDGCECYKHVYLVCNVVRLPTDFIVRSERCKRLNRALTVSDITQFSRSSLRQHVLDLCGKIVQAHLCPTKIPEAILIRREARIGHRNAIAAIIAEPHVVALVR